MIHNCEYLSPTRRVIGSDALDKVGPKLKEDGAHKVLIHYGGGDYLFHGLLDRVKKSLADSGLEYVDFPGVKPNPRLSKALEGAQFAKDNGVDYILSVGGGSAVDSAKAISLGMSYDGDLWDLWKKADTLAPGIVLTPVAGVVVYPATGAEAGSSSVILNEETREKFWEWDERLFPRFCFMDPQYTMTLPRHLLTNGIGDIMSHFTDNYLTDDAHFGIFDNLLETTLHYLQAELSHIILDPERDNLADRTELMAVASMGCDDSINWGLNHEKASHQIAHPIGGLYDTIHGSTLSIIYPQWLRYIYKYNPARFARWAEKVWDVEPKDDPLETAAEGIDRLTDWLKWLGLPVKFSDAGLHPTDEEIDFMDEPTTSLTSNEKTKLFDIIDRLRDGGATIIYISHILSEIFRLCDRATILRNGDVVGTWPVSELDFGAVCRYMSGSEVSIGTRKQSHCRRDESSVLQVKSLSRSTVVNDVSFDVRPGEVVGLAGLVGSGRTELVRLIFGADRKSGGSIAIDGKEVRIKHPSDAVKNGIGFVAEDRKHEGLVLNMPIYQNMTLAKLGELFGGGLLKRKTELDYADKSKRELSIKLGSVLDPVETLSGGNQQKVVLAKWMLEKLRVLILDEPTKGIDISAKEDVFKAIDRLTEKGIGIIFISSDLEEVFRVSDKLLIIDNGRVIREMDNEHVGEADVLDIILRSREAQKGEAK